MGYSVMETVEDQPQKARFFKTKVCKYWEEGICKRGDECMWAHSYDATRNAPNLTKTKLCRQFFSGTCTRIDCKYAHGEEELRAVSEIVSEIARIPLVESKRERKRRLKQEKAALFSQNKAETNANNQADGSSFANGKAYQSAIFGTANSESASYDLRNRNISKSSFTGLNNVSSSVSENFMSSKNFYNSKNSMIEDPRLCSHNNNHSHHFCDRLSFSGVEMAPHSDENAFNHVFKAEDQQTAMMTNQKRPTRSHDGSSMRLHAPSSSFEAPIFFKSSSSVSSFPLQTLVGDPNRNSCAFSMQLNNNNNDNNFHPHRNNNTGTCNHDHHANQQHTLDKNMSKNDKNKSIMKKNVQNKALSSNLHSRGSQFEEASSSSDLKALPSQRKEKKPSSNLEELLVVQQRQSEEQKKKILQLEKIVVEQQKLLKALNNSNNPSDLVKPSAVALRLTQPDLTPQRDYLEENVKSFKPVVNPVNELLAVKKKIEKSLLVRKVRPVDPVETPEETEEELYFENEAPPVTMVHDWAHGIGMEVAELLRHAAAKMADMKWPMINTLSEFAGNKTKFETIQDIQNNKEEIYRLIGMFHELDPVPKVKIALSGPTLFRMSMLQESVELGLDFTWTTPSVSRIVGGLAGQRIAPTPVTPPSIFQALADNHKRQTSASSTAAEIIAKLTSQQLDQTGTLSSSLSSSISLSSSDVTSVEGATSFSSSLKKEKDALASNHVKKSNLDQMQSEEAGLLAHQLRQILVVATSSSTSDSSSEENLLPPRLQENQNHLQQNDDAKNNSQGEHVRLLPSASAGIAASPQKLIAALTQADNSSKKLAFLQALSPQARQELLQNFISSSGENNSNPSTSLLSLLQQRHQPSFPATADGGAVGESFIAEAMSNSAHPFLELIKLRQQSIVDAQMLRHKMAENDRYVPSEQNNLQQMMIAQLMHNKESSERD
eukprot:GDKJ01030206.1.p1 GENE.GDKJ01030206.1~~GDKJ01030206.1.p1  ORF type:complete len:946 (-),score=277.34 GDKJ01030206.1:707-3544(-)